MRANLIGRRLRRIALAVAALACTAPMSLATTASADSKATTRVIVRFRQLPAGTDVAGVASALVDGAHGRLAAVYRHAVQGFAAELPTAAIAGLSHNPHVAAITPDITITLDAADPEVPTGVDRMEGDRNPAGVPVDVDIAVLDTGIVAHPDLNVVSTVDCTPWFGLLGCVNGNQGSVHWHATHVAGIAAAKDDGIGVEGTAPGARLWSVRVLDAQGSGSLSQILNGIDWVTARASTIDVVNMSLAGQFSDSTFDQAITNSVAAGIVYVVAASNEGQDAGSYSPANHPSVLTVSAIADSDGLPGGVGGAPSCRADQDDTFADFSNFGSVVDIAAPGVCIRSTMPGGTYGLASGTSMATPHVAGLVARYLVAQGLDPSTASGVASVRNAIVGSGLPQAGTCGFTGDPDLFAEPLAFLNATVLGGDGSCGGGGPINTPPTIAWSTPSAGAVVSGTVAVSAIVTDPDGAAADLRVNGGAWQPMAAVGGDVFSATWDTTTSPEGPATLEIRGVDGAGSMSFSARSVTVDNVAAPTPMTIGTVLSELAGKRNTDLVATVEIRSGIAPLPGAAVSGYFIVNGANRTATATTGADGVARLRGGTVRRLDFVTYFCVSSVQKAGYGLTTAVPYCVLVMP
ncbi:MAG TPA: S8 family serine peptidase [Ilumatobacteraceae bacterium]|nr:S8 family serine peptidase [Ilumatobacteraceae bacterium]